MPPGPPLLTDPGPASAHPLDPRFAVLAAESSHQHFIRGLIDLRAQVDKHALMAQQAERGLSRLESRAETLAVLEEFAAKQQAELLTLLDGLILGGKVDYVQGLRFHDRIYLSARIEVFESLRDHPAVARLIPEFDGVREAEREAGRKLARIAPAIPPGDSWGIEALGLRALWEAGIDGRGVIVGILDSGVMGEHLALINGRADPYWNDPVTGEPSTFDSKPHGSMVLSCAVGREVESRALGTAPGAHWVAAMSNHHNSYNNVNMSLAGDWLLFEGQPDVLLGAWGHGPGSCDPRDREMVQAFRAAGVVPVFAAGNDGPDPGTGQTPAALTGLFPDGKGPLAVAAIDHNLQIVDASSRGPRGCGSEIPFPDIAGPGWDVPVPTAPMNNSLTLASGTSMAVGWIGGVVALVLQIAPDMPVWEVEDLIRSTARDLPPEGIDNLSGYGLVDPAAAVAAARSWVAAHEKPARK